MKTICLYFQVHQPFRLKRYRFFNIGNDHYYYDDYLNESIVQKIANKCYLPANKILLELIRKYPDKFKVAFSISGLAIEQFELYAPEVLESFQKLAKTGNVEFLSETYSHSLAALKHKDEFQLQVNQHAEKILELFGQKPTVFRNTELIYSDEIGTRVADMGFKAMITEGAKHVLGWKSPNYLYCNNINPKLKILLKNFKLSDDIAFRFSNKGWPEYPLTAKKFVKWIKDTDHKEEMINLFMDYETFGEHQWEETKIFDFLRSFPAEVFKSSKITFSTPGEIAVNYQPVSAINVPNPISWADEERDLTAWLGNDLQDDAYDKLYGIAEKVRKTDDLKLLKDWNFLQASDHFYYMSTKFFSDGEVHSYFNPYESPYDAYINYMNVLSDFIIRVQSAIPESNREQEIANLTKIIEEKERLLAEAHEKLKTFESAKTGTRSKKTGTSSNTSTKTKNTEPDKKSSISQKKNKTEKVIS
ncbi:MAG: polysaccharide deacetylase family protein [Bacteroidetes bacterium]|jgi:alpha-amylase|nr:polysaccharide deacetylase family protein [Bacteroidota bacterium]